MAAAGQPTRLAELIAALSLATMLMGSRREFLRFMPRHYAELARHTASVPA